MGAIWQIILGLILAGVGGLATVGTLVDLRSAKRSAAWPQVQGKVLTSSVVKKGGGESNYYSAEVEYEYAVDGIPYTSDRVRFGGVSAGKRTAKQVVERYPWESTVTVYYDPQQPASSVLEQKVEIGGNTVALLFEIMLVGVGILLLFSGLFGD